MHRNMSPKGLEIFRHKDHCWEKIMTRKMNIVEKRAELKKNRSGKKYLTPFSATHSSFAKVSGFLLQMIYMTYFLDKQGEIGVSQAYQ